MGSVPLTAAQELRDVLELHQAVETGTFQGEGARALSKIYPTVVTIEVNEEIYLQAKRRLSGLAGVQCVLGDSGQVLGQYTTSTAPSFYFLDSHWSGGPTGGREQQCPVLVEIAALADGHSKDCIVIDDARQFLSAPAPPYDAIQWATLLDVIDALRRIHPDHHVTVLDDQVFAVPPEARSVIDRFGQRLNQSVWRGALRALLGERLQPWSRWRVWPRRWIGIARHRLDRIVP